MFFFPFQVFKSSFLWVVRSCMIGISFFILCCSNSFTQYTNSSVIKINVRMFFKFMSFYASCFSCIFSRISFTPKYIFLASNRFKMFWINTRLCSTKMINHHVNWYFTFNQLIRNSVCVFRCAINRETSVPVGEFSGFPVPASISFSYFGPKSFHMAGIILQVFQGQGKLV